MQSTAAADRENSLPSLALSLSLLSLLSSLFSLSLKPNQILTLSGLEGPVRRTRPGSCLYSQQRTRSKKRITSDCFRFQSSSTYCLGFYNWISRVLDRL